MDRDFGGHPIISLRGCYSFTFFLLLIFLPPRLFTRMCVWHRYRLQRYKEHDRVRNTVSAMGEFIPSQTKVCLTNIIIFVREQIVTKRLKDSCTVLAASHRKRIQKLTWSPITVETLKETARAPGATPRMWIRDGSTAASPAALVRMKFPL